MAQEDTSATDQLKDAVSELVRNLGESALDRANDAVSGLTEKFTDIGEGSGAGVAGKALGEAGEAAAEGGNPVLAGLKGTMSGVKDKVKEKVTGGGGGSSQNGDATSSTNIIESVDVGVPITVAYNQWTEFGAFPSFMKKVENVEAEADEKLTFKAQIFLSHRTWEATITAQTPDERIIWRSQGEKGHVDGSVTFHELAPSLTRILLVLEYYPQGLFEKTGNLWRAQARRTRAEMRHFRRHVMTRTILDPEQVQGWRGVIEDGEVVESHDEHVEAEEQQAAYAESEDGEASDDESEYEGELEGEEPAAEAEESEAEEYDEEPGAEVEEEGEEYEEAYDEEEGEAEGADEEPDEESTQEPAEQLSRSRRRAS